jgi:hypothetical protein
MFSWVVVIRGFVYTKHISTTLAILDIPSENRKKVIDIIMIMYLAGFSS